jgi:hypothetical protein
MRLLVLEMVGAVLMRLAQPTELVEQVWAAL